MAWFCVVVFKIALHLAMRFGACCFRSGLDFYLELVLSL